MVSKTVLVLIMVDEIQPSSHLFIDFFLSNSAFTSASESCPTFFKASDNFARSVILPDSVFASSRSIKSATPATVGASKNCRSGNSTRKASLTRDANCVANNECPPNSKKLSNTPTFSRWRSSALIPARVSSVGVRGATNVLFNSGRSTIDRPFNAIRSTFPLGVSGSTSRGIITDGSIYSGNTFT